MKKNYLLYLFALILCACSPYVDAQRSAGIARYIGQSDNNTIAICYNPLTTDKTEIEQLANETCAVTKQKAIYKDTKYINCSLSRMNTAFYDCPNWQTEERKQNHCAE